jgi:hypothetical protein
MLVLAVVVSTVLLHVHDIVDLWQLFRVYGPGVCLAGGATFVLVTLARLLYERRMLSDFGKVNSVNHMTVFRPNSVVALQAFLQQNTGRLAIKGGGYSHGGHVLVEGGTQIDMDLLKTMTYHAHNQQYTVEAGARWSDILPVLAQHGRTVAEMQVWHMWWRWG